MLPPLLLPASGSPHRGGWLGACAPAFSSNNCSEGVRQLETGRHIQIDETRGKEPASLRALILLLSKKHQEDAQILAVRIPTVLPVAGIFGYYGGAVGALFFLLLLFFFLLYISEVCSRCEATWLHGEDADPPGCQHPQSDQSPQRQLPLSAAGPLDHQRRLAGLSEVLKSFSTSICIGLVVLLFITRAAATLSEWSWSEPAARFFLTE